MEFTWDEVKREKVIAEHRIDFVKVLDVFDEEFALYFEDCEHSSNEETRFNIIGKSVYYGLVFVAFVYDASEDIRLITARRAENWMVKEYEENRKRL